MALKENEKKNYIKQKWNMEDDGDPFTEFKLMKLKRCREFAC